MNPAAPKRHLRVLQPSMSKTDLIFECQWPWGREVPNVFPEEPALYGSAFHEIMAAKVLSPPRKIDIPAVAAKWSVANVELSAAELTEHVRIALGSLAAWLAGENPWKVNFTKHAQARAEQAIAYDVMKRRARTTTSPREEDHFYEGLNPHEFPGSMDLTIDRINTRSRTAPDLVVLDYKTGFEAAPPHESGQMHALGTAAAKRVGAKRVGVVIFHTPRANNNPFIMADILPPARQKAFADGIKQRWPLIGSGALRPGPHCETMYCPAIGSCPAHVNALVQVRTDGLTLTPELVGEIHMKKAMFDTASEALGKELRAWVRENGDAVRPDGMRVTLREQMRENLSKKAFEEKLGAKAAEALFEEWRKKGILVAKPIEQLIAVKGE